MNSMAAGIPPLVLSLLRFGKPMKSHPMLSDISSVWIYIKPDWNPESSFSSICIELQLTLQMQLNVLVYRKGRGFPPAPMQFTNGASISWPFNPYTHWDPLSKFWLLFCHFTSYWLLGEVLSFFSCCCCCLFSLYLAQSPISLFSAESPQGIGTLHLKQKAFLLLEGWGSVPCMFLLPLEVSLRVHGFILCQT